MSTIPLTVQGAQRLEKEMEHLKYVVRPEVINAIAEARAQGDLSENAEYDAARERQAFVEGRIRALEGTLDRKSTRLNSSHVAISYAVFCLKKKMCKRTNSSMPGSDNNIMQCKLN